MKSGAFKLLESIKAKPYELALAVPVLLGIKPASTITLTENDEDTYEVEKKLQDIGLMTHVVIREDSPRIHIAMTKENLKNLVETNFYDNYNLGLAYGYPKSAVNAAQKGNLLRADQTPPTDQFIIAFSMSPKNWQEEYKIMQKWNKAIEKHTPKLYKESLKTV